MVSCFQLITKQMWFTPLSLFRVWWRYWCSLYQVAFTSSSSIQVVSTWCLIQTEAPATLSWMINAFPNQINSCWVLIFILAYYGKLEPLLTTLPCDSNTKWQSLSVFKQLLFTWTLQQVCNPLILFRNVRILELHPFLRCPLRGTLQSAHWTQATFQEILINFPPNKTLELCQGSHQVLYEFFVFLLIATYSWETKTMINLRWRGTLKAM